MQATCVCCPCAQLQGPGSGTSRAGVASPKLTAPRIARRAYCWNRKRSEYWRRAKTWTTLYLPQRRLRWERDLINQGTKAVKEAAPTKWVSLGCLPSRHSERSSLPGWLPRSSPANTKGSPSTRTSTGDSPSPPPAGHAVLRHYLRAAAPRPAQRAQPSRAAGPGSALMLRLLPPLPRFPPRAFPGTVSADPPACRWLGGKDNLHLRWISNGKTDWRRRLSVLSVLPPPPIETSLQPEPSPCQR